MHFQDKVVYYDTEAFAYFYFSPTDLDSDLHPANVKEGYISPQVKCEFFHKMFKQNLWKKWVKNPQNIDELDIWRQYSTVESFWKPVDVSSKDITNTHHAIHGVYFSELGEKMKEHNIDQRDVLHLAYAENVGADVLITLDSGYIDYTHRKKIDQVLESLERFVIADHSKNPQNLEIGRISRISTVS